MPKQNDRFTYLKRLSTQLSYYEISVILYLKDEADRPNMYDGCGEDMYCDELLILEDELTIAPNS